MMYCACANDELFKVTDSSKPGNNVIFGEYDISCVDYKFSTRLNSCGLLEWIVGLMVHFAHT